MKNLLQIIVSFYLIVIGQLQTITVSDNCNYYPNSSTQCISKASSFKCQYNMQLGKCLETIQQNLGCSKNLNKEACINQLTNNQGDNVYCVFFEVCHTIDLAEVQQLGCLDRVNKLACMSVQKQKCSWNNKCELLTENSIKNTHPCDQHDTAVTPYTCQQSISGLCMNSGLEGDYRCVEVRLDQLSTITCNQPGLNDKACISIRTDDQYCVFQDDECKSIQPNQVVSCDQLNKNACISAMKLNQKQLLCEWIDSSCRIFKQNEYKCQTNNEVNALVCVSSQYLCMYDEKQKKCKSIETNKIKALGCNAPGLSKQACLKIKSQNCSFYKGICQELNQEDLTFYKCNMDLNEKACVNLKSSSQFCLWNGNNCQELFINQDIDCPIYKKNSQIKMNGNVCQAISKPNVMCKYDNINNVCIKSSINDQCNTPFLNQFGCVSILNSKETCQWTNNGCKLIAIEQQSTTCESLGYANPISCSQVYENNNIGCYFDKAKQQCISILVNVDDKLIKQLLNTIKCDDFSLGLNKVICGSITTESTPCRWFQEQCVYISKRSDIANVPCLHLQNSNYQACALASFQNEPCKFSQKLLGCTNTLEQNNSNCDQLGLNKDGCQLINLINKSANCYYDKYKCISKIYVEPIDEGTQTVDSPFNSYKCNSPQLTKLDCALIVSNGQLCQWSQESASCKEISVQYNTKCIQYMGKNITINPFVCAAIQTDQSDNCGYDKTTTSCKIFSEGCTTPCCTEIDVIGINAHTCSRQTSQKGQEEENKDVYCYFYGFRCMQLQNDIVDTSDENQVQQFFNNLGLLCTQMNFKTCHMINWSKSQRCHYDGYVCKNLNVSSIKNLLDLTSENARLNQFGCLSIEAEVTDINKEKYFGYDAENKRCKVLPKETFSECRLAYGNKNVCTGLTQNIYCMWDSDELQCVDIKEEELREQTTCNSGLNSEACINIDSVNKNSKLPCFFSDDTDFCQEAPEQVQCNYFVGKGKISQSVCKGINLQGQICEYSEKDKTCIKSETKFDSCDVSQTNANNRACYSNTNGNCRWDSSALKCYENQTEIVELKCTDNLNKILCLQVVKEACMWDDIKYQCQIFIPKTSQEFENSNTNVNHLYNQKACLLISGAGYYYNKDTKKCIKIDETKNNFSCDQYQMNQYACLYLTRGNPCFYDQIDQLCKSFEDEQSQCNTSNLINIEVCMKIPVACVFNESTLQCQSFNVQQTMTCTQLFNYSKNKIHHNKISCASVSPSLTEIIDEKVCSQEKEHTQKCKFEKYCFWNQWTYSCEVYKLLVDYFDTGRSKTQEIITCPDTANEEKGCEKNLSEYQSELYVPSKLIQLKSQTNWINSTCLNQTQIYTRMYTYKHIEDVSQDCEITICSKSEQIICTENILNFQISDQINKLDEQRNDGYSAKEIHVISTFDDDKLTKVCPKQFNFPYDQLYSKTCRREVYVILNPWCQLINNEIRTCDDSVSQGVCLELNQERCYFDINQGGCRYFENNEHKLPDCTSISNNCFASQSKNAICQNGNVVKQPGNSCLSIQKDQQICISLGNQYSSIPCNQISKDLSQPILCAKATDICRFDGIQCVNTLPDPCSCDKSYSKALCESPRCNCVLDYLGYCQKKGSTLYPQLNQDCSNKYYLCYEVNTFVTLNKQKVCGLVDQACKFTDKCEDATHSTCSQLSGLAVSQQACVRCTGLAMQYNQNDQKCNPIASEITQCENLNKQACLSFSKNIYCQWQKFLSVKCNQKKYVFACKAISGIQSTDQIDCSTLNYDSCNKEQMNLCWFNPESKLCEKYSPLKGKCELYKNKSSCMLSMVESCKWNGQTCQSYLISQNYYCDGLNKYGCLNFQLLPCVWSDSQLKCESAQFSSNQVNCTQFLSNYSNVSHMNGQTCTQITSDNSCILGNNYKCREILEPTFYACETQGLNKKACLSKTINACAFKNNKCISFYNTNEGCQTYLNEQACLRQDAICTFNQGFCQEFKFTSIFDIIQNKFAPYSEKVCHVFDNQLALIYSYKQKICLIVDNLKKKLTDCTQFGINKYACINYVENYCKYQDGQCQYINPSSIKDCQNLNSYACSQVENVKCKFQFNEKNMDKNICMPITKSDTCASIAGIYKVNKKICQMDEQMACQYDSKNKSCQSEIKEQITCNGNNRAACIFSTLNLLCEFDENEKNCQSSFGYSLCTDSVNKQKCLAIISIGQFCEFDQNNGCQTISKLDLIQNCDSSYQTNPITCSQSTNKPCFYNKINLTCIEYTPYKYIDNLDNLNNSSDKSYQNYVISNIYSLNKKACELFDYVIYKQESGKLSKKMIKLSWYNGACMEIKVIQQFNRMNCDQILNNYGCVLIKTTFQYCHFKDNKCQEVDYKTYSNQGCITIQNINSGAFCAQTTDVKCQYDSQLFRCVEVPENATIECVDKDPDQKGYNKLACETNSNCVFKEACLKKTEKGDNQFCEDAIQKSDCPFVKLEGCMINNDNCVKITIQDYKEIKCDQAQNQIGCTNIQTVGENCQFLENKCIKQELIQMRNKKCQELNNVNNQEFCQYPNDTECAFDYVEKSCKEVSDYDNLTCSQGINRKACLKLRNKGLECSYLDSCFGPNQIDENCRLENESCSLAISIQTCLFQSYCKCQWQDNKCKGSSIDTTLITCDKIQDSSVAVCNSIKNCILNTIDYKCKLIQPQSCEEMQSHNQCSRMTTLPCIWNEKEQYCMYLESQEVNFGEMSSASMNCQDITFLNGNQRACMNIVKQGQLCIFQDNQCKTFMQEQTQNNCLDNININSCLQQKISDCYWKVQIYNVKKTLEGSESEQIYGNCIKFDKFDNYDKKEIYDCDSKLSYTSCLKIKKEGVFCRWKNNQCQIIYDNELIHFKPSNLTEVNQNSCGLVNNGDIVKYHQNINFCITVDDFLPLTCVTEGLNKDACLNIKFQNCLWDITKKKCIEKIPTLDTKQNSCKIKNLSSNLCSQLKLDQPCGFIKDGCDFVDLDQITCTHEGLNQYACLHIKNYPCIWLKNNDENYHCEDYLQYLPCDQIPSNVNQKVCQIVREEACYYNELNFNCEIPNQNQKSCELTGLNIIGCVQIENCYYDQKCQSLNKKIYTCNEFPIANKLICKNAIDSCKYYEFQYGCSTNQEENCSNDSLSDQGCLSQPNCVLQADGCKCRKFVETYDCTEIKDMDICKLENRCIVQKQYDQQFQVCKLKTCQDYSSDECEGKSILKSICYWSAYNQCLPAQKCQDIIQPFFKCSTYYFDNKPCQMNNNSTMCEQFNCQNFGEEQCLKYKQFCNYNQTCQIKQCPEFKMEDCIINGCEWNQKENICQNEIDCSKFVKKAQCNNQNYNSKPCQWVVNNNKQFCTQYRCSNILQQKQCSGTRIGFEFCVEINDTFCFSCEEISDSCDCLQQSQYCSYDIVKDRCTSKSCESYLTQEECPTSYCTFIQQKCQISCEFKYTEDQCLQINECEWIEEYQKCQKQCSYLQDEEQCTQKDSPDIIVENWGEIITGLIILNLIFM